MTRYKLRLLPFGSAKYVVMHAQWRASRGRRPSACFGSERNPVKALLLAKQEIVRLEQETVSLIEQFENDIWFDCHSVEAKVNRSDAREELQRKGRSVLTQIGNHLLFRFPKGGFFSEGAGKEEIFVAWGYLLFGIVRDHNLREQCPYTSKTPFGEQDMQVWAKFCLVQAF